MKARHTRSFIPKISQSLIEDNCFSVFCFDLAAFLPSAPHATAASALLSKDQTVVWSLEWERLLQPRKQTHSIDQLSPAPVASMHSLCLGSCEPTSRGVAENLVSHHSLSLAISDHHHLLFTLLHGGRALAGFGRISYRKNRP